MRKTLLAALCVVAATLSVATAQAQGSGVTILQPTPVVPTPPVILAPDFYTYYSMSKSKTAVFWVTCAGGPYKNQCYGAGNLWPFNRVCALLEGAEATVGTTTTRYLYALDGQSTAVANVVLKIFKKKITATGTSYVPASYLEYAITLPITGGPNSACSMAANDTYIFIATGLGGVIRFNKTTLAYDQLPGVSQTAPILAITAETSGFIAVTSGSQANAITSLYDPSGALVQTAYTSGVLLNERNALLP